MHQAHSKLNTTPKCEPPPPPFSCCEEEDVCGTARGGGGGGGGEVDILFNVIEFN